jgi:PhnB protein
LFKLTNYKMKAINITLLFDGEAEAAITFYKSVFGGEFTNFQRMKDMPGAPPMNAEESEKILHSALQIDNSVIMAMDAPAGRMQLNKGNNFMITVHTGSEDETTRFFNALARGGHIMMPVEHQFWGAFFGMVTDKFGIQWQLSYAK